MADAIDPNTLDKRTARRYITAGVVDEKTYERALKSLPDVAEKSTPIEADLELSADMDADA
ncbi:MAG: hypothetical protein ACKVPX_15455 [Myxococcaceae bacterium]